MKYLLIAFLFVGCCSKETITDTKVVIQWDTLKVTIPADTVFTPIVLDSTGFGENDNVSVKVDTVLKTVFVKGKEKIIKVIIRDTVSVTNTETKVVKESSWLSDVKWIIGGIFGLSVIGLIIKFWR